MPGAAPVEANARQAYGDRGGYQRWNVVPDYSLSSGGAEVVSPILTDADDAALRAVCRSLKATGGRTSRRCGLHVTVGMPASVAPNMRDAAARRIMFAWLKVEREVFKTLSNSRQNNRYCPKNSESWCVNGDGSALEMLNGNGEFDAILKNKMRALNTGKMYRETMSRTPARGVVEFRCHQSTLNPRKILLWSKFCRDFVKAVLEMPLGKAVRVTVRDFNRRGLGGVQRLVADVLAANAGTRMAYTTVARMVAESGDCGESVVLAPRQVRGAIKRLKRRNAPIAICGRGVARWETETPVALTDGVAATPDNTPDWTWKKGQENSVLQYMERRAAAFGRAMVESV